MTDVINTREIVLAVLNEVLEEDKYSHIVLREVLEKYQYLEKETAPSSREWQKEPWKTSSRWTISSPSFPA